MTDADLQQKRLIAAVIDIAVLIVLAIAVGIAHLVIAMVVRAVGLHGIVAMEASAVVSFASSVAFLAYMLARDVIASGQSIGKKTQGIRAVTTSGQPLALMDSVKRNAIFAIGSALGTVASAIQLVPIVGCVAGCLLMPLMLGGALLSLVAAIVEIVKIIQDPEGIRFGDQWANTRVVR